MSEVPIDFDVVFCHPSRVGGGPVRTLLQEVYADRHRVEYNSFPPSLRFGRPSEVSFLFDLVCRYQPRPIRALTTNFLVPIELLGPVSAAPRFVTMLRHPLERICSEFLQFRDQSERWRKAADKNIKALSRDVETFAETMRRHEFYVRLFGQKEVFEPVDETDLERAVTVMHGFDHVGFMQRIPDTLAYVAASVHPELSDAAGKTVARLYDEATRQESRAKAFLARLPRSTRAQLEEANALDLALYNQAPGRP